MSYIIDFIIPLVYFICTNGVSVLLFKKSFGKCLPMTLMATSFIVFLSQVFFKTFIVGYIINILLLPLLVFLLIKNKNNIEDFKKNFFSNGFYIFILFYFILFFFDLNRQLMKWDEYSHWGVMVKEMFRLDKFYSTKHSTLLVHKDYPPIIPIYELFYAKLTFSFKGEILIKALRLFNFSLIIPFLEDANNKKNTVIKSTICLVVLFLIILLFDQHDVINTIYIDYTVSLLTAYLLSFIFMEKDMFDKFNIINILIVLSFLMLSKQIGLPFCLMVMFIYGGKVLLMKNDKKKSIIVIALITIIPLVFFIGWNRYVSTLNIDKQFVISDVVGKRTKKWQKQAATNYVNAVNNYSLVTSYLKINYITWLVIVLVLLYLICRKEYNRKERILLGITYTLGFIGYYFVMLALYTTSFGPDEGVGIASFNRYMPSFVLICVSSLYMILINKISIKKILIILIIMIYIQDTAQLTKMIPKVKKNSKHIFEMKAEKIKKYTKKNSKVFVIAQNTVGEYQYGINFYLDSQVTNPKYYLFPIHGNNYKNFYYDIEDYLFEYDYLFISNIDPIFPELYDFMFDERPEENNIYKIDKKNHKFILIKGE